MVAGIAPATHAPEDVKDAPLPLDLHQTQATPALSDGYMSAEETVLDYYEALRRGEPLYSYFAEDADTWKAAISAEHEGYDAVAEALREQTRVTGDWTVESRGLSVLERDDYARFTDRVRLAWTRTDDGERVEYDTRWSGVLEPVDDEGAWAFVQLHVSAPHDG